MICILMKWADTERLTDDALLQESAVIKLGQPNPSRLMFLVNWMQDIRMGYVHLLGSDSDIWSKPDMNDLVALKAPSADDKFTTWVSDTAIPTFHSVLGRCFRVCPRSETVHKTVTDQ